MRQKALDALRAAFGEMAAAEVADLLLSPFVAPRLLNESTDEPGPSLWIVNRSDVYDATLAALARHPLLDIAARARAKQAQRTHPDQALSPPRLSVPLEQIPDHGVEDILGHPLVPWEAALFFARSLNEDHRASAALSVTRRLLEHRTASELWSERLRASFATGLRDDPSPFVRAYIARVPLLESADLEPALASENHPFVYGRLLQNPALSDGLLIAGAERVLREAALQEPFNLRVLAFDARLPTPLRQALGGLNAASDDPLAAAIHAWHLALD